MIFMKKLATLSAAFAILSSTAYAVCPVCVVAVGSVLAVLREMGIDDAISGLWYGALILSTSMWTVDWLQKKGKNFPYIDYVVFAAYLLLFVAPLPFLGIIGQPGNSIFGVDKLLIGTAFGLVIFLFSVFSDKKLRDLNNGKVMVYYQKVIIPVVYLTISSVIVWLVLGLLR